MTVNTLPHSELALSLRKDFKVLDVRVGKRNVAYFDNGATGLTPTCVTEAIANYYDNLSSNIHRGVHTLSQKTTDLFEEARKSIQDSIGAKHTEEVIFTSGTTHSINIVASSFTQKHIKKGDVILSSLMEHHSNIVPWQIAAEKVGATVKPIQINSKGELDLDSLQELLQNNPVKIVAITHVSNTLGTINPVKEIAKMVHAAGAYLLVDGAQAIPHFPVNVTEIDCDFYAFSGHKAYGPTGIGVLYGKKDILQDLPPYQGGGNMIAEVSFEKTTFGELPHRFEAGTLPIAQAIGLGKAMQYLRENEHAKLTEYEDALLEYATAQLKKIKGLKIIGEADKKAGVISFVIEGTHPYDVGVILDKLGVAVRTGHHCTQPLMQFFDLPGGTIRASLSFYNTVEEVDALVAGVDRAVAMFC